MPLQSIFAFVYFLGLGAVSLLILKKDISLTTIMQIFSVLLIAIAVSAKFIFPKIKYPTKIYVILLALLPVALLIYFLVQTTGLLFSPFLILTHFFAIGLAFLISPAISFSFVLATLTLLAVQLFSDRSLVPLISTSPLLAGLYFISYVGLIPFSYILAKEYKVKEEWAAILEKQIATSQIQEQQLLKNIEEAILGIDTNYKILYFNETARDLLKIGAPDFKQDFYKIFKLKDKEGRDLFSNSLPFQQTISSKLPQEVKNLQIAGKNKRFIAIDLKIIPAITAEGPIGLVLVLSDKSKEGIIQRQQENTATAALERFLYFLEEEKKTLESLAATSSLKDKVASLLETNQELGHLASDFIYSVRLESGEIGAISQLVNLGNLLENLLREEKAKTAAFNVILSEPIITKDSPLQPKKNLKISLTKRLFPQIYVLGNEQLIADSISKILELAARISTQRSIVTLLLEKEADLAKVIIHCANPTIQIAQTPMLFEKFYPQIGQTAQLISASGLEGYIAKSLLSQMGASVNVEAQKNMPGYSFVVTFGAKNPLSQANP